MVTRRRNIDVMIAIYRAADPMQAHLLRGILENEGITAEVIGESLFSVRGEAPITSETLPIVAVARDEDVERARQIAEAFDAGRPLDELPGSE